MSFLAVVDSVETIVILKKHIFRHTRVMNSSSIPHPVRSLSSISVRTLTLARWCVLLSLGLMTASAIGYLPGNRSLTLPLLLFVAGGIALGAALWLNRELGIPQAARTAVPADRPIRWRIFAGGVVLLALLAARNSQQMILPSAVFGLMNIHIQVVVLVLGVLLLVAGAGGLRRSDMQRLWSALWARRREGLLVLAIAMIAFVPRTYELQDMVRAFMDEGPFMAAVVGMRDNPQAPMLAPLHATASSTRMFPYVQLVLSDIFGSSLTMFRMGAVVFGVLTVMLTYGLARVLFDRKTALAAGVLLAMFPPHIHMSRIGIYNIADPVFGLAALIGFAAALRERRRVYYVFAGVMLGALPYFYEGGELLYPALLVAWAVYLWVAGPQKPSRRGMLWLALAAVLVAAPVYFTSLTYHLPLFTRFDDTNLGGDFWLPVLLAPNGLNTLLLYWKERILPAVLHYMHAPDASLFYSGDTALILPYLVPPFFLGIVHALRRPRAVLLLMWLVLTVLGNSLIVYNNWTARFVVVMPAVAILCAVGLRYTLPVLAGERVQPVLKALLLVFSLAQIVYYFGTHMPLYNHRIMDLRKHYDVAFRIFDLPEENIVYFNFEDHIQLPFTYDFLKYVGDPHEFHGERFDNYDLTNLDPNKRYAFFIDPLDKAALAKVEVLWYLDGPYFADNGIPRETQYGLYYATPWLRRDFADAS